MSNVDRAAKVIDQWTQEGYELNSAVGSPHAIAERLAKAGLLAPDLPEADWGTTRGATWYLPYHIGDIRRMGEHIVAFGHDYREQSFRLVLTEAETETIAHTLLAAAHYREEA